MTTSSDRVAIIGGGLGALAAACTLAGRGYPVTLFERSSAMGGRVSVLEEGGYRFDIGPLFLRMPRVLDRIFRECNRKLFDHLDLVRLDPQWRCFFPDGGVLDLCTDVDRMCDQLEQFAPGSGKGYHRFLKWSKRMAHVTDKHLHWRNVGKLSDVLNTRTLFNLTTIPELMSLKLGRSVAQFVRSCVADDRIAKMLQKFTMGTGLSPGQMPAMMCCMAHNQLADGLWYPRGGNGAVLNALLQIAIALGAEIRPGDGIQEIELDSTGRAIAVIVDQYERVPVRAVVSSIGTEATHQELLPEVNEREKRSTEQPTNTRISMLLGLDRTYDHLLHHNFFFCKNEAGQLSDGPTLHVHAPARTDPTVAPAGGEALSIHVQIQGWEPLKTMSSLPEYRAAIISKLAVAGKMPDLLSRIKFESMTISQDCTSPCLSKWTGVFRPPNRSPDVPGVYFAGNSVHPGLGMAMELMSGWIAADALDEDAFRSGSQPMQRVEPY